MAGSPRLSGLRSSLGMGSEVTSLEVSAMGAASKLAAVLATYPQQVQSYADVCACICHVQAHWAGSQSKLHTLCAFIAASCQALALDVPQPSANVLMVMQLVTSIQLRPD